MDLMYVLRQTGGIEAIASQLGIPPAMAEACAGALLPAIVGGFSKQSEAAGGGEGGLGQLIDEYQVGAAVGLWPAVGARSTLTGRQMTHRWDPGLQCRRDTMTGTFGVHHESGLVGARRSWAPWGQRLHRRALVAVVIALVVGLSPDRGGPERPSLVVVWYR